MQVDALWTLGLLGCHFCQDQWKIQYTQCISYFFNISNLHCLHISHILWVFTGNDPVIFHWYLGFAVHHFRGLIQEQCHQALQEVAILWLCLTWILFFDWVKEMWCFERVKICKNQFIDFVVPTSMRGTWLAKTNNFRCFWGSSEKNWKQRLHFESFVPQFSSESSHFPGVPCHILMCCASRQRFYITSLWSYPLSSVMRVTCRRESLLILLTICWLIPWFLHLSTSIVNNFVNSDVSVIQKLGSKVLVSKRRELRDQVGRKNTSRTWRFLEMSSYSSRSKGSWLFEDYFWENDVTFSEKWHVSSGKST